MADSIIQLFMKTYTICLMVTRMKDTINFFYFNLSKNQKQ